MTGLVFTTSTCAKCDAEIVWTRTLRDKSMPIDPLPDPTGRLVVHAWQATAHGMAPIVRQAHGGDELTAPRYTSHFATCPFADQFRRK